MKYKVSFQLSLKMMSISSKCLKQLPFWNYIVTKHGLHKADQNFIGFQRETFWGTKTKQNKKSKHQHPLKKNVCEVQPVRKMTRGKQLEVWRETGKKAWQSWIHIKDQNVEQHPKDHLGVKMTTKLLSHLTIDFMDKSLHVYLLQKSLVADFHLLRVCLQTPKLKPTCHTIMWSVKMNFRNQLNILDTAYFIILLPHQAFISKRKRACIVFLRKRTRPHSGEPQLLDSFVYTNQSVPFTLETEFRTQGKF